MTEKSGEQTPVYAITFELYENGVSRALLLDYGDFVLTGEMTSLEMKDAKPCQVAAHGHSAPLSIQACLA